MIASLFLAATLATDPVLDRNPLLRDFAKPPQEARPQTWWHWMNNCVSPTGITNELRAISAAGFGGVHLFNAGWCGGAPTEPVTPFLSDGWKQNLRLSLAMCKELGLDFTAQNGAGWSGTGGPWNAPSNSMMQVYTTEKRLKGGESARIEKPDVKDWPRVFPRKGPRWYGDIAVLAFPVCRRGVPTALDKEGNSSSGARGEDTASTEIRDLSSTIAADGSVTFAAPADGREWVLLRVGYRNNGWVNDPSPEGSWGPAGSLLDREVTERHLANYFDRILAEDRALGGGIVKNLLLDSWECGSQNWCHDFPAEFLKRRGYDVRDVLPTYAGYVVDSPERTAKLVSDARLTVDELLKENYFDVISGYCRRHGLKQIVEGFACGAGVFDGESYTPYFSCDVPMTESDRIVEAVSSAHLRGLSEVAYEAHTGQADWDQSPRDFKRHEDDQFLKGITRLVMHTYDHNATPERRYPGPAFGGFGACFQLGQTWWPQAHAWTDYLARCQALLSRGRAQTDVLVISDRITSDRPEGLPSGYSCDFVSSRYFEKLSDDVKGRYRMIVRDPTPESFVEMSFEPDLAARGMSVGVAFNGIHRVEGETDIYFVCRRTVRPEGSEMGFRVKGKVPYLLDPLTGNIYACQTWREEKGYTWLPMIEGSATQATRFVVFVPKSWRGDLPVASDEGIEEDPAISAAEATRTSPLHGNEGVEVLVGGAFTGWTLTFDNLGFKRVFEGDVSFNWATKEETCGYSGTGVYRAWYAVEGPLVADGRYKLRLGKVDVSCEVLIDGKSCGVAWCEPYELDVTEAVKGKASFGLELRVVNTWRNRLIADEKLSPEERKTWTTKTRLKATDKPSASGLQGPVVLLKVEGAKLIAVDATSSSRQIRTVKIPSDAMGTSRLRLSPVLTLTGTAEYPGFFYEDDEVVFPVLLKPEDRLQVAADGIWQLRSSNGELRASGQVRPIPDLSKIHDPSSCAPQKDRFNLVPIAR